MKVNSNPPTDTAQAVEKARENQRSHKSEARVGKESSTARANNTASTVDISENAKLLQKAVELVHDSSSFRADRVADLKNRIAEGSYHVDSADIADRLIEDHLGSNFGKNNL